MDSVQDLREKCLIFNGFQQLSKIDDFIAYH